MCSTAAEDKAKAKVPGQELATAAVTVPDKDAPDRPEGAMMPGTLPRAAETASQS